MTTVSLPRAATLAITDKQVYGLLFAATFPVFLVAVVIQRLGRVVAGRPTSSARSIFAEARETGSSTLLFAFMG